MRHLLGALIGLAVWAGVQLVLQGWSPRRTPLAERLAAASRPPTRHRSLTVRLKSIAVPDHEHGTLGEDLAVLDRSIDEYLTNRVVLIAGLAVMPLCFAVVTGLGGGLQWSPGAVAVLCCVGAIFGAVMSRATLSSQAAQRRRGFVAELSQYLDVVALQVAGSSGIDDALRRAAVGSDSPGISQIRRALDRARARNESPWDCLGALAEQIRVPELDELISTVRLGDDRGARIRQTLTAKADSLRATQDAEALSRSERASERMGIPVVAMFFGFLALMIAPLMSQLASL